MSDMRWCALGFACASWAALIVYFSLPEEVTLRQGWHYLRMLMPMRMVYALCAWSAMVAACGFAQRHLNGDGGSRRYLTEAVFPVYLLHQTLIIALAT